MIYTVTYMKPIDSIYHEIYSGAIFLKKVGNITTTTIEVGSGKTHNIAVYGIDKFGNKSLASNVIVKNPVLLIETKSPVTTDWLYNFGGVNIVDDSIMPNNSPNFYYHYGRIFNIPITQDFELECNLQGNLSSEAMFGLTYGAYWGVKDYNAFSALLSADVELSHFESIKNTISGSPTLTKKYTLKGIGDTISFLIDGVWHYTFADKRIRDMYAIFNVRNNLLGFNNIKLKLL